jgi:A/G-specific adenine glycosylase
MAPARAVALESRKGAGGSRSAFARKLIEWHRDHSRTFPWRQRGCSPWEVLIAEVLLRQTDAKRVVPIYLALLSRAPSPRDLGPISIAELEELLRPLGLFRQRAQALHDLALAIDERHEGEVPVEATELARLPHVGPYAAGGVVVFAGSKNAPLPDINIGRVAGRYFGSSWSKRSELHSLARRVKGLTTRSRAADFYYALLDLSATVCRPKPRCQLCPLESGCRYARDRRPKRDG